MDLAHFIRVSARYKLTIACGLLLSLALTFLALYKVDLRHGYAITPRQPQTYQANATLFVTQPGFPWGRTITQYLPGDQKTALPSVPAADETRLATLTALYAQLALGDPVRRQLGVDAPRSLRKVSVTPVSAPPYVNPAILPLLNVTAIAPTPAGAVQLANDASDRFGSWLKHEQETAGIPADRRVTLEVVDRAEKATLAGHRSKTLPAVVFLGLMAATFGLVFVRENLNPRVRTAEAAAEAQPVSVPSRLAS